MSSRRIESNGFHSSITCEKYHHVSLLSLDHRHLVKKIQTNVLFQDFAFPDMRRIAEDYRANVKIEPCAVLSFESDEEAILI